MSESILIIDTPKTCGDCPCCIFTADEKRSIGYCHTSDEDYYCKILKRFMEYDKVDGGIDILGRPADCPLRAYKEGGKRIMPEEINVVCVGDIRHRYKGDIIQYWDFDYNDNILRIDFKDGSFIEYQKKNIICVEMCHVPKDKGAE